MFEYTDELQWECDPEIAEEIGKMGCLSIQRAGELLGMNVPLAGDYDIGKSWAETH